MTGKKSRYKNTRLFEGDLYRGLRARDITPAEGVVEHQIREGDRLDLLARHYYNDSRLWWRILDANPEIQFGGDLTLDPPAHASGDEKARSTLVGHIILIPGARQR